MKKILFLIPILIFSCISREKSNEVPNEISEITYKILIKDNDKYCEYLSENISNKLIAKKENPSLLKYDSLTKEYLSFLSEIEKQISTETSKFFFEDEKYSKKGEEFIFKTKTYKSEIEKLIKSENLKKRLNLVLNTNNIKQTEKDIAENNENNEILVDDIYIKYLDYYFKGYPKNQSVAFLNSKKRSILELENEFIASEIK